MSFDRRTVVQNISRVGAEGNAQGLIEGFGVYVNRLPSGFWNGFADRIVNSVPSELQGAAWHLLYNAGHECGYHTGYGIVNSEEWKSIVQPHVKKVPEDVLHGAFAVFTGWGWGKTEIVELVPNERLVVRAYDYYEADVARNGLRQNGLAPMITGVSTAFMELAYGGPYPNGLGTFHGQQVKGIECGDDYGEFVITRVM
jgi:hypothetical protein